MAPRGTPPLAAVLAGGAARRLGGAKATASLGGRPLIDYPLSALRRAGLEAVVVAKPATALPRLEVPVLREPAQPTHPLAGILAALRHAGGRRLMVVACDMPLVTAPLLRWMAALDEPLAVPRAGGRLHPLLARYGAEHADALERALADGRSLSAAVSALEPRVVGETELRRFGEPERLLFNVNSPDDLEHAEQLIAGR